MFHFHEDRGLYFQTQINNTKEYVLPFIEKTFPIVEGMRVLEVGCGEGGVLKAFIDRGCFGLGVELEKDRIEIGEKNLQQEIAEGKLVFENKNIYDSSFQEKFHQQFDLIILKDVIEHIHDQEKILRELKTYLKPSGKIFFGFPPWQMPFGGHQQMCKSRFLARLPYYHLLPTFLYKSILKIGGEVQLTIDGLLEVKETGISIERFERILKRTGYKIDNRTFYLFNPIYKYKFGVEAKEQFPILKSIPYLRDFFTTAMYYLVSID